VIKLDEFARMYRNKIGFFLRDAGSLI